MLNNRNILKSEGMRNISAGISVFSGLVEAVDGLDRIGDGGVWRGWIFWPLFLIVPEEEIIICKSFGENVWQRGSCDLTHAKKIPQRRFFDYALLLINQVLVEIRGIPPIPR